MPIYFGSTPIASVKKAAETLSSLKVPSIANPGQLVETLLAPPAQVTGLAVDATGDGTIDLSWAAPASDAAITDYVVEYTAPYVEAGDQYWANVALLLPLNGNNSSTTFTDLSTNAITVTRSGNASISTAESKFGGSSAFFDGFGDRLNISNAAIAPGEGDFAVEFWLRASAVNVNKVLYAFAGDADPGLWLRSNGTIAFYYDGSTYAASAAISANEWYHVAVSRASGVVRVFVDGLPSSTTHTFTNSITSTSASIGGVSGFDAGTLSGYIDDFRLTIGSARGYTAAFTPPAAAHPDNGNAGQAAVNETAQTGSTAASYTLTSLTNDTEYSVRVAAVSAAGTGAYSAAVTGTPSAAATSTTAVLLNYNNSLTDSGPTGYTFNGGANSSFDSANVKFGSHSRALTLYEADSNVGSHWKDIFTGDFTVEMFWRYNSGVLGNTAYAAGAWGLFDSTGANYDGCAIFADFYSSKAIGWYWYLGGSGSSGTLYSTTPLIDDGTFRHIAIVREGTEFRLYYDGSLIASNTAANNDAPFVSTSHELQVGKDPYMMGYDGTDGNIDDFRISSSALYSGQTYTIPTAELT